MPFWEAIKSSFARRRREKHAEIEEEEDEVAAEEWELTARPRNVRRAAIDMHNPIDQSRSLSTTEAATTSAVTDRRGSALGDDAGTQKRGVISRMVRVERGMKEKIAIHWWSLSRCL